MSKKDKYKKVNSYSSDSDEMMRMLKMLGVVILILGAFYIIFAIASGEISFGDKKKEVKIQNVEILAGNSFSREDLSYYVLMYDFKDNSSVIYANLYDMFVENYGTAKLYVVDLNKKFNSKYVTNDASQVNTDSIDTLKVVNGTLIKFEDGKSVARAVGEEEIKKLLFT
jgi:hypothetical protein